MIRRRFAIAVATAAAIILSAPFVQQAFTSVGEAWPRQSRAIGIAATALPVAAAVVFALVRIRHRRLSRYLALAGALAIGVSYVLISGLSFPETFHFVEYGLLAWLWYRAWRPIEDGSVLTLPLLAGIIVATLDEWFQWFIPIRAGEARDVLINGIALGCGLLFALGLDPPKLFSMKLRRGSRAHVTVWAVVAAVVFGLFFETVHIGHEVGDPEIGSFRSRFTATELASAARDRAERWRDRPPIVLRRLWREDQYLTEALWHVQNRNEGWAEGDLASAWRENRILEKFYPPVLDTPTYADAAGHRWTAARRAEVAERAGARSAPFANDRYPYPLYVWPR